VETYFVRKTHVLYVRYMGMTHCLKVPHTRTQQHRYEYM